MYNFVCKINFIAIFLYTDRVSRIEPLACYTRGSIRLTRSVHLGTKYVTTIQSLELSPRNICEDIFLKTGILRAKVHAKNVPNVELCKFVPASLRTLSI